MKLLHIPLTLALSLALTNPLLAQKHASIEDHPAYLNIDAALDLKVIKPAVNVNLPRFLLNSALSEFDGGEGDPIASLGINLKELTQDVKLIRVVVLEANDDTKAAITKGLAQLRNELESTWTPIVAAPAENVFVYARSDEAGEDLAGLALLVSDGDETVIGNLVGNVPIGKIARIAAKMGGEMIPAEVLQALGGFGHPDHKHDAAEPVEVEIEVEASDIELEAPETNVHETIEVRETRNADENAETASDQKIRR